jgi:hypothetical protein
MKINIDSVQSVSIRNEYKNAHCNHANFFGSFRHPDHPDSQDWCITLYSVCDELVFETNGDPVWEVTNHSEFAALVLEYGISIEDATADEYTEDGTLHDYKTGDSIRRATPQESADSIEAAKSDKGAGVIIVNGRSCYVSR